MTTAITRAQFLRGDLRGKQTTLRPPWALAEQRFVDACSRCGECINACPESILAKGHGGFPMVDFRNGECSFCGACADRCADGALQRHPGAAPWRVRAYIDDQCIARRGVVCAACGEACEHGSIRFAAIVGGVPRPEVNLSACTGCGGCVQLCPVGAVSIRHPSSQEFQS